MRIIKLSMSDNYRWMWGNRYIKAKTARILIDILKIAKVV